MTIAIVRGIPTSYANATTKTPLGAIDVTLAKAQHAAYVEALTTLGATIHRVPVADEQPDCVFVEDHAIVVGDLALACRLGHPPRRDEAGPVREALAQYRMVVTMEEGTVDGGDVLCLGRTLFVGRSDRTDALGVHRIERTFAPHGYAVLAIPLGDWLHLKCVASPLDDRTVLLAKDTVDPRPFERVADIVWTSREDAYAANAVAVGPNRGVIVAAGFPRVAETLDRKGFNVLPVDVSEIRKGDGSCTCLSIVLP